MWSGADKRQIMWKYIHGVQKKLPNKCYTEHSEREGTAIAMSLSKLLSPVKLYVHAVQFALSQKLLQT